MRRREQLPTLALCGLGTAFVDETIQPFSGGRAGMIQDVWIDCGCAVSILLHYFWGSKGYQCICREVNSYKLDRICIMRYNGKVGNVSNTILVDIISDTIGRVRYVTL